MAEEFQRHQELSVQLSHVQLFVTPRTVAYQVSLSITNSRSLPKLMCIESVMPSNHLFLCCPLPLRPSFWASGSFPVNQFFVSGGQSIGVSAWASVLPVNIQDWFPLGWIGWIILLSGGFSTRINVDVQVVYLFLSQFFHLLFFIMFMLCTLLFIFNWWIIAL